MTEMHSFVFLASNKPNKIITNGNVTAFISNGWWTCRPIWLYGYMAQDKKGGPKLLNEKVSLSFSCYLDREVQIVLRLLNHPCFHT